ncbi:MAG TPA: alkaline phosphatase family protein [Chloroflexia bacterium]|nr:alkaline phosphatase family protein [Chloroflexia bacterium]
MFLSQFNFKFRVHRKTSFILASLLILLLTLSACGENATSTVTAVPTSAASVTTATSTSTTIPATTAPLATAVPATAGSTATSTAPVAATKTSNAATATPPVTTANVASSSVTPAATTASATATAMTGVTGGQNFDRVFIIVLENADYASALAQPYLAQLAKEGTLLKNYFAVTHPSYPNYLAMVGGSTFGVTSDGQTDIAKTSLADLMEAKNVSWKAYAEQYPANQGCFKGVLQGKYVRKHMPFLSFTGVQSNPAWCNKIVPASQLQMDVAKGNLPQFVFYEPDLNNDGHDTGVAFASKWLQGFLPPLLQNPQLASNTLFVVTFDEGTNGSSNQVYTVLAGGPVKAGASSTSAYTHYSLLRTIEDNFGLGTLQREDTKATPFTDVWKNKQ